MLIVSRSMLMSLLLYVSLIANANSTATSVTGLIINTIQQSDKSQTKMQGQQEAVKNGMLDDLLKDCKFKESPVEEIQIQFQEKNEIEGINNVDPTHASNEEEVSKKIEKANNANTSRVQSNLYPNQKSLKECCLKADEVPPEQHMSGSFTQRLCTKLARDAFKIANTDTKHRTRESTTCLCVALMQDDKKVLKLVFHNGERMTPSMKDKANELAYTENNFKGYAGHAEAQFINFLLSLRNTPVQLYTHILGMGCSRPHCKECDFLLKLFLGERYYLFTAAMNKESPDSTQEMPIVIEKEKYECVTLKIPETQNHYKAVTQQEAIRGSNRPHNTNYYLTDIIKNRSINAQIRILIFTGLGLLSLENNST